MVLGQRSPHKQSSKFVAKRAALVAALVLLGAPSVALANSGTPMMWLSWVHLALGNVIIGLGEGVALTPLLRGKILRSIVIMIAANYASAWCGYAALPWVQCAGKAVCGDATLENVGSRLAAMAIVYLIATVLIEWPFVWFAAARDRRSVWRVTAACVAVNVASYALLAALYYWVSGPTLLTQFSRRPVGEFAHRSAGVWVYYIDDATDRLARVRTDGGEREVLDRPLPAHAVAESRVDWFSGGFLAGRDEGDGTFTLRSNPGDPTRTTLGELDTVYGPAPGSGAASTRVLGPAWDDWIPETFRWSFSLREPAVRRKVQTGFWPLEGLSVEEGETMLAWVAWETPFEAWTARSATELEDGFVVYQLGKDQIALLDPVNRTIGLLARGRCPVVVEER